MDKNVCRLIVVLVLSGFICGCATIVSKSSRPITIASVPEQANVTITDETGMKIHTATTPTTVTLKTGAGYFQGKDYTVVVSKDGYQDQTVRISKTLNGWYIGNILFGGLIGWLIVDPISGAMWTLSPQQVNVSLEQLKTSMAVEDDGSFSVVLLQDVPVDVRDQMVRVN